MSVLERDIENKVVRWAIDRGVLTIKLNLIGRRGWPDRIFFIEGGKPLLIEFKRPGEKPRILQNFIHKELIRLGYNFYVCDNTEDGKHAIQKAVESARLSKESC